MRGTRSSRSAAVALAAALVAGACATTDSNATSPTAPPPTTPAAATACAGSGTIQLASLQSARVDCSSGTTLTLAGGGASYLVVPNFAAGEQANTSTSYVIGATGVSATASVLPVVNVAASAAAVQRAWAGWTGAAGPGLLQDRFDAGLRSLAARNLGAGRWRAPAFAASAPAAVGPAGARFSIAGAPPAPALGSLRTFHVFNSIDPAKVGFAAVTARLQYAGNNILLYQDTASPPNGFTQPQIDAFAQVFDQVLYPIDVNNFGPPSDIDQNGRLIMLLTPVVNALSPKAQCSTQGYVAGFFTGNDLANTDTTSNQGEVFYALAPDPTGSVSCAHTVANLEDELGATFLHELQHLINFSQHVLVRHSSEEEGWLDEGLSLVAEELGSLYYEQKYPPPAGRSNPAQLFPDSAEGFMAGNLEDSYTYLLKTDTTTLTLHSDDELGLAWRGGDWLLLRWLGDQKGGAAFYKALDQSARTGIANIEAAAGEPFPSLFGDFSVALYTDSLPGIARGQIPARDRFSTRNLRLLYGRLFAIAQGSPDVPFAFPIQPRSLPATGQVSATMVPGTMAFYRLTSASSASTVTITFSTPAGASLPARLQPQLSVFRLPPGQ